MFLLIFALFVFKKNIKFISFVFYTLLQEILKTLQIFFAPSLVL